MSTVSNPDGAPPPTEIEALYLAADSSEEFQALRRRHRRWVLPVIALGLGWYFLYVLLADYAHGFMGTKVVGNINVGILLGLLQFVSTFVITTLYVRWANTHLDPEAERIRRHIEGDHQ